MKVGEGRKRLREKVSRGESKQGGKGRVGDKLIMGESVQREKVSREESTKGVKVSEGRK